MKLHTLVLPLLAALALGANTPAAGPRVLPMGELPADHRLAPLKDLDGYFPFTPPAGAADWAPRAERIRRRVLVSQGLWPLPTKAPLNAVIHGRVDRGEYTVEKVFFESAPGFFVTGNLYRPKQTTGKVPAVLFAHGHWTDARLSETPDAELRREIATGQERFEQGGKSRFQSLCVQLARMGCVVWQYDMLGDSDSRQISAALNHHYAKARPEMNTVENWGLFSPQAEAHLQSTMGLQTWNSIRSLDFVLSLPEVDPDRVAVTGASGGATQTLMVSAVDPRVALAFPAVMVSTAMQGGCTCENASLLRVGVGNVDFAALFAPKPLGMTCANDWTREFPQKGFPDLQTLYTRLGAADHVMLNRGEQFPHNYNAVSRGAFYGWLNRHFKLGAAEPVIERDYQPLAKADLTVWDAAHPAPAEADPALERRLLRRWHEDSERQLARLAETQPDQYRAVLRGGWDIVLDGGLAETGTAGWEMRHKEDRGTWIEMAGLLRNAARQEELPAVFCYPKHWNGHTVLWLTETGKAGLYAADGNLLPAVQKLVDAGATVLGMDLLDQGEFLAPGQTFRQTPKVANPREAAAYTFGYNSAVFVHRVHDVLGAVNYIRSHERPSERLSLVALDGTAPIAAAARAQAGNSFQRTALHLGDFRFARLLDFRAPDFLPGGAKYGDVPALLALGQGELKEVGGPDAPETAVAWLAH